MYAYVIAICVMHVFGNSISLFIIYFHFSLIIAIQLLFKYSENYIDTYFQSGFTVKLGIRIHIFGTVK